MLEHIEAECVACDVTHLRSDAVSVDALARLQLLAKRYGRQIRLRHAHKDLKQLIELMGLSAVLPADD